MKKKRMRMKSQEINKIHKPYQKKIKIIEIQFKRWEIGG